MKRAPASAIEPRAEPRVRRGYFECRFGQLHVHNAMPPGGGFDEGTALLCLHETPLSGRVFKGFLPIMARDRSVYAPDLPGHGESDPAPAQSSIADYAGAIADFLGTMRFRQIDILGRQAGAAIAVELAIARPQQVRRVVLASVPLMNDAEREVFRRPPAQPAEDGAHLPAEWRRVRQGYGASAPLEVVGKRFAEQLLGQGDASSASQAVAQYALRDRLAHVSQPALVLRLKDELWDATLRAREALPRARFVELAEQGSGAFELAPQAIADAVREFLKG